MGRRYARNANAVHPVVFAGGLVGLAIAFAVLAASGATRSSWSQARDHGASTISGSSQTAPAR